MQPKGGVTLIIAVGGGSPSSHGHSNSKKEGREMIRIPIDALVSEGEGGDIVSPEVGDSVVMNDVGGEITAINEDGTAHVEITSAGGVPVEYVGSEAEAVDEVEDIEGAELLASAVEEDENMEY
jgi:hypothetical protein